MFMTLSSLRVSCDSNTISMLTFTCCNVIPIWRDKKNINMTMNGDQVRFYLRIYCRTLGGTCTNNLGDSNCVWNSFKLVSHIMKCQYKSGVRQWNAVGREIKCPNVKKWPDSSCLKSHSQWWKQWTVVVLNDSPC